MSANTRIFEAVFRFRSFFYEIAHEVGSILHQPLFFVFGLEAIDELEVLDKLEALDNLDSLENLSIFL